VLLPDDFDADAARTYPLLLLLHGAGDDWQAWTVKGDVDRIAAGSRFVIAMPDGGPEGWYTDWYGRGIGGPRWETYHIAELLPFLQARYHTDDRRAVAGLSMGGHGALSYAARHPEIFRAVGSFSGVDHLTFMSPLSELAVSLAELAPHQISPLDVWGDIWARPLRLREHNPGDLAENLGTARLFLYWGNGRSNGAPSFDDLKAGIAESFLSLMNQAFVARLRTEGETPEVHAGNGVHGWADWQRYLTDALARLEAAAEEPRPHPDSFDFTSAASTFDAWGWHVVMARPAAEFAELRDAGRNGFTARGSGTMHVTTAPAYCRGVAYEVRQYRAGVETVTRTAPDRGGRLHVDVDLGPGHTAEDWTLPVRLARQTWGDGYLSRSDVTVAGPTVGACPPPGHGVT